MPVPPDVYTELLTFITKIASSVADDKVIVEAKRLLGKMLLHRPAPDPARVLDAAQEEERRKRGKRLARKNGTALGSATYNPPTNGTSHLQGSSGKQNPKSDPQPAEMPATPAKRFWWTESKMGDLTELVIMDGKKVYDCYILFRLGRAGTVICAGRALFATEKCNRRSSSFTLLTLLNAARGTGSTVKTIFSVLEGSTRWSWSCGMRVTVCPHRPGQRGERPSGVGFDEETVSDLVKPGADWRVLRRNVGCRHPGFGGNELELWIFDSVFCSLETYLNSWRRKDIGFVESYAIKELEITRGRLSSLASGLKAMGRVNDLVALTVLKYESAPPVRRASTEDILGAFPLLRDTDHDVDGEFTFPGDTSTRDTVSEFQLTIPIRLGWSANGREVATFVMPILAC